MRVLVIGSGGREHALCWSIAASPLLTKLWCAPGNPGIAQVAECVPIGALDFPALVAFAQDNEIDLVVPGPEAPLVAGIDAVVHLAGIAHAGPGIAEDRYDHINHRATAALAAAARAAGIARLVFVSAGSAPDGVRLLLGVDHEGIAYFGVAGPLPDPPRETVRPVPLREAGPLLSDREQPRPLEPEELLRVVVGVDETS